MRCKNIDTLLLGTPGILCNWALQGYFSVGPCRDIWWLGTAGILCGWAAGILCGWAHPLSIAGILIGWALQGVTAGILGGWAAGMICGWALQGYLVLGH